MTLLYLKNRCGNFRQQIYCFRYDTQYTGYRQKKCNFILVWMRQTLNEIIISCQIVQFFRVLKVDISLIIYK